MLDVDDTESEV